MAAMRHSRRAALVYVYVLIALACLLAVTLLLPGSGGTPSAEAHSIVLDGLTNDWCAPGLLGGMLPDTFGTFPCPAPIGGTETIWSDRTVPPPMDTIGYMLGGGWGIPPYAPGPVPDPEVDLVALAVTDDCQGLNFLVLMGPFPAWGGPPPHVQIAIDTVPGPGGNTWYDPVPPAMTFAPFVGVAGGFSWDYLIATDVVAGTAFVWTPGFPGPAPVPLVWAPAAPGTSVIEIMVPWPMLGGLPPPGTVYNFAAMATHSRASIGPASAPLTDPDDVISQAAGPLPNTTANEIAFDFSVDFRFPHTIADCIPTPTPTDTPAPTATATDTPSPTPTHTPTPTGTPLPPTWTPTPTVTPTPRYELQVPLALKNAVGP